MSNFSKNIIFVAFMRWLFIFCLLGYNPFTFAQKATINIENQTVVYYKHSYPLTINVNKKDEKNVVIKASQGIIISKDKKSFTPYPAAEKLSYIYLGIKKKNDTIWVDTLMMKVKYLSGPFAIFGKIHQDGIPKSIKSLYEDNKMRIRYSPYVMLNDSFVVDSFEISLYFANNDYLSYKINGDTIPYNIFQKIRFLDNVRYLSFNNVNCHSIVTNKNYKLNYSNLIMFDTYKIGYQRKLIYHRIEHSEPRFNWKFLLPNDSIKKIESGLITYAYKTADGIFKELHNISDSIVTKKVWMEDDGNRIYEMKRNDSLWDFTQYHKNEKIQYKTQVSETIRYIGTMDIFEAYLDMYYNKYGESCFVRPPYLKTKKEALESEIHFIGMHHDLTPVGDFTVYNENGTPKIRGQFATTYLDFSNPKENRSPDPISTFLCSVMDGVWFFYDENGNFIEKQTYQLGKLIQTED